MKKINILKDNAKLNGNPGPPNSVYKKPAIQRTMLNLQGRFGKNAVLKGMNLMEGATTKERNGQVGGHKAE